MKRSPLHDLNESLGARFVPFGPWEMPVQYEGVLVEHRSVRNSVGVFDVTHLGRFSLTGAGSHVAVRELLCNDIDRIEPGRCQYTMMLNPDGGIVDDLIVWWWGENDFWVMPNATNHDRVMSAFAARPGCEVADLQGSSVFLAVQGPDALRVLVDVLGESPKRFRNLTCDWRGAPIHLAGTGYTGEAGAEVSAPADVGTELFEAFLEAGATPCGLGARDTLRLEAGLALWGEDIDEASTPLEAGLGFAVDLDHEFVGRERLIRQRDEGISKVLTGFVMVDKGIPRSGYAIRNAVGATGNVTSGNISPILEIGIGMGYMSPPDFGDQRVEVQIRDRWVEGRIAKPPFHEQ